MTLNPTSATIDPGALAVIHAKASHVAHFKFFVMKCEQAWFDGQWTVIQEYSTNHICGYQATEPGMYLFAIHMAQDPGNPDPNAPGGLLTMTLTEEDLAIGYQPGDDTWSQWVEDETEYWTLPANCVSMLRGHTRAMQYILKWMYCFHPGQAGTSRKLCISELNDPDCYGHYGAHQNGTDIDLNYYTLGSDNKTQCLFPTYPEKIFVSGDLDDPVSPDKFDLVRNWALWKKMIEVFPQVVFRVDVRIRDFVCMELSAADGLLFAEHSMGDNPGEYHHNTHCHCSLDSEINWLGLQGVSLIGLRYNGCTPGG